MIYPAGFEQKIGFSQVRELLESRCISELGREEIKRIGFSDDPEKIGVLLDQTEEFRQILLSGQTFPSQDYFNLIPLLRQLSVEGTWPEPEQLSELRLALLSAGLIITFFDQNEMDCPALRRMMEDHLENTALVAGVISGLCKHIGGIVDEQSRVKSSASPELGRIRKKISDIRSSGEKRIGQIFRQARQMDIIPDGAELTYRDGRLLIPIISAYKKKIPGMILDESATGQTIYLEPTELFEMNNEIRELGYAEHREIIRILIGVADRIRPDIRLFILANSFLGIVDMVRAKAAFALDTEAMKGKRFSPFPLIRWENARHPLLLLSLRKTGRQIVPLALELEEKQRVLVISGPNAGGKSICLKTVGLIQYMFQCGLLPPADDGSEFGVFKTLMLEIGDEQSLENDLSTYTSKLLSMKFFLTNLGPGSLFLIDEMGTGTDPALGGAIAEAALRKMTLSGAFGVVTTHYSNLKLLAGNIDGVVNGAMLFDGREMRPLYRLKTGFPGSSYAFEIAAGIGFPPEVLEDASLITGRSQLDFNRQIQDVEMEKESVSKKSKELRLADEFLHEMIGKYTEKSEELDRKSRQILDQAKKDASRLLAETNRIIELTIKEIRESQADRERTKKARKEMEDFGKGINPDVPDEPVKPSTMYPSPGEVKSSVRGIGEIVGEKLKEHTLSIDIRGMRADEAFLVIRRYIDDSILLAVSEVRILHGKGNGILRDTTRNYLRSVKEVKKFHDEDIERGGAGITVVHF
jgi:DNA mismatch repair protein MutS2